MFITSGFNTAGFIAMFYDFLKFCLGFTVAPLTEDTAGKSVLLW